MRSVSFLVIGLLLFGMPGRLVADEKSMTLSNGYGVSLRFTQTEDGWFWTNLATPGGVREGWEITDDIIDIATADRDELLGDGWTLVERVAEKAVFEREAPATGFRVRRVFSFGSAINAVRIETWVQSAEGKRLLTRIGLLDVRVVGETFRETGVAPASFPLFGEMLFAGIEHVSGESSTSDEPTGRVRLMQRPRLTVDETWQRVATVVVGWPAPGGTSGLTGEARIRDAFLQYLDTVRIKPNRIVLHTDTWWTVPLPLTEKNVLNDIEALRKGFAERTGMFFDTYCVDLGWSDPRTFWRMENQRMPNGLHVINERLNALGSRMGLWMSPGSGYPDGLSNAWLQSQGYEMTPFEGKLGQVPCFALGGRYQREFKERIVAYAKEYNLDHVILDFMPQRCDVAAHGHPVGPESRYAIDAGLADVLDALRAVNPNIALEPMVCGYPPSPWWLMKTPFVLGPAGDDLPYGRGPCPEWLESLITARDVAYRAGQEAWIMPTQALETFDIIVLTPGDFENMAVMAIGRGRWFISTYFNSELMKPEDWDFLAGLVRWARENKQYLGNAWMFGGQPENREAYGFMFRNPTKDLYCVRNPWIEERAIELPASPASTEAREVRMIYPRRQTVARIEAGGAGPRIIVPPYETAFFETVPVGEVPPETPAIPTPVVDVIAGAPRILTNPVSLPAEDVSGIRYYWDGALSMPDVIDAELCILIEGKPEVRGAICKVLLSGREAKVRKVTSAGQFGAAIDASPENWAWFIVPLAKTDDAFQIDLTVSLENADIGIYVRGFVPAGNDANPEEGAVFPTFRADRKPWSQTLQPLRTHIAR